MSDLRPALRRALAVAVFPLTYGTACWLLVRASDGGNPPGYLLPALVGGSAVLIALCEHLLPFAPEWNRPRGDLLTDALHSTLSSIAVPALYRAMLLALLAPFAAALARAWGGSLWPTGQSLWIQGPLACLLAEATSYWAHRLAHEHDLLWRLHATHHSPGRLYGLNAGRDHPLGVLLLLGSEMLPLVVLGATEGAFAFYALTTGIVGLFQHANVDIRLGPLNWIFSAAELHRWHHSKVIAEANSNYGSNLIVWDVVFGTRFLPAGRHPPLDVGIAGLEHFPRDYWRQLAVPFRWRRLWAGDWPPPHP